MFQQFYYVFYIKSQKKLMMMMNWTIFWQIHDIINYKFIHTIYHSLNLVNVLHWFVHATMKSKSFWMSISIKWDTFQVLIHPPSSIPFFFFDTMGWKYFWNSKVIFIPKYGRLWQPICLSFGYGGSCIMEDGGIQSNVVNFLIRSCLSEFCLGKRCGMLLHKWINLNVVKAPS